MRNFYTFEEEAVEWAAFAALPPRFGGRKNRSSPAQKAGLKYEAKAQPYIQALYPDTYVASPWLVFRLRGEPMLRWCQPDGIIIDPWQSRITVVEIKLRHMAEAYTQINGIYIPVLKKIFSRPWQMRQVEVVRWYDPSTPFPVPIQLVSDLSLVPYGRFAVHIWNP